VKVGRNEGSIVESVNNFERSKKLCGKAGRGFSFLQKYKVVFS
jgi:hypothetical protein